MKLTYRGISYNHKSPVEQQLKMDKVKAGSEPSGRSNFDCIRKYRLSAQYDSNKIAWLCPITYYTYRGVSYTKRPLTNAKTQLLQ